MPAYEPLYEQNKAEYNAQSENDKYFKNQTYNNFRQSIWVSFFLYKKSSLLISYFWYLECQSSWRSYACFGWSRWWWYCDGISQDLT
jgi:hypothetical protein